MLSRTQLNSLSWDGSTSCNTAIGGEAEVGYSGSVLGLLVVLVVVCNQHGAGAGDGERMRPEAGTGNE